MGFDSLREKGSVDYLDVGEDGGLDEEALVAARLSPGQQRSPLTLPMLDE